MKPMICTSWAGRRSRSSPATTCRGSVVVASTSEAITPRVPLASSAQAPEQAVLGQPQRADVDAAGRWRRTA